MKRSLAHALSTTLPRSVIRELKASDAEQFAELDEAAVDRTAYASTPYGTLLTTTELPQAEGARTPGTTSILLPFFIV